MASPSPRCGFALTESDVDVDRPSDSCQRPVWNDTDRCVWHEETDDKSFSDLEASAPIQDACLDGAYLYGIDFEGGIDFSDCTFVGAHMEDVDFADSSFEGADFDAANLFDVDFSDVSSLKGATFRDASLFEVHLEERDLTGANFRNTTCESVYFDGATLTNTSFEGEDLDLHDTQFLEAPLRRATFSDGQLHTVRFDEATLSNSTFSETELTDTTFNGSETSFANVEFESVDLKRGVEYLGATLRDVAFRDVSTESRVTFDGIDSGAGAPPRFEDCELVDSTFREAGLEDVHFERVDLSIAKFRDASLDEADFIECTLTGSDFSAQDGTTSLETALFSAVDLRDVDFSGTKLYQTIFSDVRIDTRTTFDATCVYERGVEPTVGDEDVDRYAAAAWVYRRLESLHESNALAETAHAFHIRASEARRTHLQRQLFGTVPRESSPVRTGIQYVGSELNRLLTNHGESLGRIVGWSIVTILGAAFLYPFLGGVTDGSDVYRFPVDRLLRGDVETFVRSFSLPNVVEVFGRSLYFSSVTFTTIGDASVDPVGFGAHALLAVESVAGAVLIALFVFVLGRQVNR